MAERKDDDVIVDVQQVYSKSENWVLENQKSLSIIVGAVVLMFASYFAYKNLYYAPQEEEAREYMWQAQQAFAKDSFNLALNGSEASYGFLYVIDNYGITEQANLAHYYVGISYLKMGDYETAIEYLEDFDCNDIMVCAVAMGATGDAYMELGDTERAIDYYLNAANHSENELTAPIYLMKAGHAYETLGQYEKAIGVYNRVKNTFPRSTEAQSIEKYIARAEGLAAN